MTSKQATLIEIAKDMQSWVTDIRRHLHQIPELCWKEEETLEFILQQVNAAEANAQRSQKPKVDIHHQAKGGIWVDVTFDENLDRILLRSDVDALPIQEETGLLFSSRNDGVMHACGHDAHAAMLLGAFKALMDNDIQVIHNLRFVYQRAEENPIKGSGGATLVEEGVLNGVTEAYALHIWSSSDAGLFLSRPGPMMANSDRLKIVVQCTGGHVAAPHQGSNAIDIAADIQVALRGFDTRFLGPNEPVSFVPAIFKSGTAGNIRPARAELWFAVRNVLGPEKRKEFHDAITTYVEAVVSKYGYLDSKAKVEVTPIYGHPALANSSESYEKVRSTLDKAGQKTAEIELLMGGEDFAHYLELYGGVPGSAWLLGAYQEDAGGHHTPTFNPDESVFWRGVLFWLLLACSE